jgi:hypothetical protein
VASGLIRIRVNLEFVISLGTPVQLDVGGSSTHDDSLIRRDDREGMVEVCVTGAGPAGTVFGARLAQLGYRVHLTERVRFPRRHLGESLSPVVMPLQGLPPSPMLLQIARSWSRRMPFAPGTAIALWLVNHGILVEQNGGDVVR